MSKKKPAYVDGKFVGDTLSISVKPHYQKEYEFLKSHHNRSGLICELVRQFLEGGGMPIGYQLPVYQEPQVEIKKENVESKEETKEKEVKSEDTHKDISSEKTKEKTKEVENAVPVMSMPAFL